MFYLIKRTAYVAIGGHRAVRGLAVEDIGIGKRIKAAGLGLLFANGRKVLRTRMYSNFNEIIQGWTRILAASMNYRVGHVLAQLFTHLLISLPVFILALWAYVPTARELCPSCWFVLPAMHIVATALICHLFYPELGVPRRYAVLFPLGNLVLIIVLGTILKKIWSKDALQWRGTTYSTNRYQPTHLDPVPSSAYSGTSTLLADCSASTGRRDTYRGAAVIRTPSE
jgi:hypothetical protein